MQTDTVKKRQQRALLTSPLNESPHSFTPAFVTQKTSTGSQSPLETATSPAALTETVEALMKLDTKINGQFSNLQSAILDSIKEMSVTCSHVADQCDALATQVKQLEVWVKRENKTSRASSFGEVLQERCDTTDIDALAAHTCLNTGNIDALAAQACLCIPCEPSDNSVGIWKIWDTVDTDPEDPPRPCDKQLEKSKCVLDGEFGRQEEAFRGLFHKLELALQSHQKDVGYQMRKILDKVDLVAQCNATEGPRLCGLLDRVERALQPRSPRGSFVMLDSPMCAMGSRDSHASFSAHDQASSVLHLSHGSISAESSTSFVRQISSAEAICSAGRSYSQGSPSGAQSPAPAHNGHANGHVSVHLPVDPNNVARALTLVKEEAARAAKRKKGGADEQDKKGVTLFSRLFIIPSLSSLVFGSLGMKASDKIDDRERRRSVFNHNTTNRGAHGTFAALIFGSDEGNVLANQILSSKTCCYSSSHWAADVIQSRVFINFGLWVICLNALYIAILTDICRAGSIYTHSWFFIVTSNLFCTFYAIEWMIRFIAFRRKAFALTRFGHFVDTILAILAVLETWIIEPLLCLFFNKDDHPETFIQILRILWLIRFVRLLQHVPELLQLMRGIVAAMQAVFWTLFWMLLLTFTFAMILYTVLQDEHSIHRLMGRRNFETLAGAMWTLFIDCALLTDFGEKATILVHAKRAKLIVACAVMTVYMIIAVLVTFNMLIGVMNQVVGAMTAREKTESAIALVRDTILKQLIRFDDGNGLVSRAELEHVMQSTESETVLRKLKVDRLFLCELQAMLFPTSESQVPISRVMELMLLCRGDSVITVRSLGSGLLYLSSLIRQLERSPSSAPGSANKRHVYVSA